MATKNNRRIKLTKMLLKNSLIGLMNTKPVNAITIKEICEQADLNRSTFYLHYTDQYQLLKEIQDELLTDTLSYLKDVSNDCSTILYIRFFLEYVKSNAPIFRILLCQPENAGFQSVFIEKTMGHVKSNLPSICSMETEKYVYGFVMHGCLQIIREWISSGFDLPENEMADIIYTLCHEIYQPEDQSSAAGSEP